MGSGLEHLSSVAASMTFALLGDCVSFSICDVAAYYSSKSDIDKLLGEVLLNEPLKSLETSE